MTEFVFGNLRISAPNIHAARYGYEEIIRRGLAQSEQGSLSLPGELWLIRWLRVGTVQTAELPADVLPGQPPVFCSTG